MGSAETEELIFLDAAISRLESTIHSLLSQRARLRQRVNALRSPIYALPVEVLATIFEQTCADEWTESLSFERRLAISSVCHHWRNVVWSTPRLWAYIDCTTFQKNTIEMLNIYLTNSGSSPSKFLLPMTGKFEPEIVHRIIDRAFSERAASIHQLDLTLIDEPAWRFLLSGATTFEFTNLRSLELVFTPKHLSPVNTPLVFRVPRLTVITLHRPPIDIECHLPFHNIISLRLVNTCPAQAIRIMVHCPRLVEFSLVRDYNVIRGLAAVESHPGLQLDEKVTFPSLERFTWQYAKHLDDTTCVKSIRLPSVTNLCFEIPLRNTEDFKPLLESMMMAQCLECDLNPNTVDVLESLPPVQNLTITGGQLTFRTMSTFFERLAEGRRSILPQLVRLDIRTGGLDWTCPSTKFFLDNLVVILESRRKSGLWGSRLEEFVLRVPKIDGVSQAMTERQTASFRRLVEGGLHLVIVDNDTGLVNF